MLTLGVPPAPLKLEDVRQIRPGRVVLQHAAYRDDPLLDPSVTTLAAARGLDIRRRETPTRHHPGLDKQLADIVEHRGLVLVDKPQNVAVGFHDRAADGPLGMEGIAHDHDSAQGQACQHGRGDHNLMFFPLNLGLGQHHARFGQIGR